MKLSFMNSILVSEQGRAQGGCSGCPGNCPYALLDSGCPSEEKKIVQWM